MFKRERRPRHPGEILDRHFLKPRKISITRFAEATGLTRKHISSIVHGRSDLSPESAVRFALVLGTSAEFWINLQTAVQIWDANRKLNDDRNEGVEIGAFAA